MPTRCRRARHAALATLGSLLLVFGTVATGPAQAGANGPSDEKTARQADTYTNPIGQSAARNFADPTMIRGRDGYWYAYSTSGPRFAGDGPHKMKIARSRDLVDWDYVGDVFTEETEPRYDGYGDDAQRLYWAPDVEYVGGRYLLYYSYVVNDGSDRHWRAIGVATAPSPAGPWTDSGEYVTGPETWEPRPGEQGWRNVIDPEVVATPEGDRYLYYGSVLGGVRAVRLSEDGLHAVGDRVQLTPENRNEAAHLVHRDGYYYLFLSAIGGCCAGPVSAYPVQVARSTSPTGPFVDRDGHSVLDPHAGGTPVQVPNGNRWVSVGHNTLATDVSGQDWLVTHGIDRYNPYLQDFVNARPMLLTRLDWIDGWPVARAGRGAPEEAETAPVADARVADSFEAGSSIGDTWVPTSGWEVRQEAAGGHARVDASGGANVLHARPALQGDTRVRGAVRLDSSSGGSAGFVLSDDGEDGAGGRVEVVIDEARQQLRVAGSRGGAEVRGDAAPLPANFAYQDWHEIQVEVRDGQLRAEVTDAGLHDPVAVVDVSLPDGLRAGRTGLVAEQTVASFDDITAAPLFTPVTERAPDPKVGSEASEYGEEFDAELDSAWQWLRDPAARREDGQLVFPIQQAELIDQRSGAEDAASVLLRNPPEGAWTAETKLTVPFGDSLPYGWPQAGFVAHADDDNFVALNYGARVRTRHVSFGKEMPWDSRVLWGDARLGPTADTMWLRLKHHIDSETKEHHYRAATSVDGENWVWHGVRTLPANSSPRIGLAAFGIERDDGLEARFDYVRFYQE